MTKKLVLLIMLFFSLSPVFGDVAPEVEERVIIVDHLLDGSDPNIDGNCLTADMVCTLRAAIQEANHRLQGERMKIRLQAGTYVLSVGDQEGVGEANTGDLDITHSLIIEGAGREATIIDATTQSA